MDNLTVLFNETSEFYSTSINSESAVLLGEDGEIKSAITLDFPLFIFKVICSLIGIPPNFIVFIIILCQRRLLNKPRNIFLLATLFSNLMAFVPAVLEIAYYINPNEILCKLYVATLGLPDVFLLQNIFLSQIDRYVAIEKPLWHRTKFTSPLAVLCVVICFVISSVINKFLYIFQMVQLDCHVHFTAGKIIAFVLIILFVLCIIARVIVFIQTRNLLRSSCNPTVSVIPDNIELDGLNNDGSRAVPAPSETAVELRKTSTNHQTLRQLEDLATRTMVAGVTSLIVLTCPLLVFFLTLTICRKVNGPQKCFQMGLLAPYFKQLSLIHAIYHPIMHLAWNSELFVNSEEPSTNDERARRRDSTYD